MHQLHDILLSAIEHNASDIHITAGRPLTFRIDGELQAMDQELLMPPEIDTLILPLLEGNERLMTTLKEEGQVDFAYSIHGQGRFRINAFHQRGTLGMVLRLLPYRIPDPEELGVPESVRELITRKRGIVLVTGATGSGKSTTLASLIHQINIRQKRHIITLEDPIEYLHKHDKSIVNQREVGQDTVSFASALRAALREDPDVILVGEMRDLDTISTAITAAETGHLVFSTLHTNSAADTIERVIDVFPPYQQQQIRVQLAGVIEGVVAQQLLPKASGSGRVAAFEVMLSSPAIRSLIRENKSFQIPSQLQTNKRAGMQTMDDSLYNLYMKNLITADDCVAYAHDISAMMKKVII